MHAERRIVNIADPSAGSAAVLPVGGACEVKVVACSFTLTAAGGGGVRTPSITFVDGRGNAFYTVGVPFTVASGNASLVSFGLEVSPFGGTNSATMGAGIPPMRLYNGLSVELGADALGGSDTITGAAFFIEQYPVRDDYEYADERAEMMQALAGG